MFVTDNGTGSAALVTVGAALLVAAGLWDRLESLEFAGTKMQLRVVERLGQRAEEAEARGDVAVAAELRAEAQAFLAEARPLAASYERLRDSLAAGPARTARLESVVAEARAAARRGGYDASQVRELFKSGTDGDRICALVVMQEDESTRDFEIVLDAIERSRSAFEQWHALSLAQMMLPSLPSDRRQELEVLLTDRPGNVVYIEPGTDRYQIAQAILSNLRASTTDTEPPRTLD